MNADKILELIAKGFALIEAIRQTSEEASPAIKAMWELVTNWQSGTEITEEQLAEVERILDEQLTKFNEPLPDEDVN